jgi:hypothetical protein
MTGLVVGIPTSRYLARQLIRMRAYSSLRKKNNRSEEATNTVTEEAKNNRSEEDIEHTQ